MAGLRRSMVEEDVDVSVVLDSLELSASDREKIFCQNAKRLMNIE